MRWPWMVRPFFPPNYRRFKKVGRSGQNSYGKTHPPAWWIWLSSFFFLPLWAKVMRCPSRRSYLRLPSMFPIGLDEDGWSIPYPWCWQPSRGPVLLRQLTRQPLGQRYPLPKDVWNPDQPPVWSDHHCAPASWHVPRRPRGIESLQC